MGSIAKNGLRQYLIQLQQHPLRTKAITAAVLSAISDIIAQKLTGIQKLQLRRLLLKVLVPWGGNLAYLVGVPHAGRAKDVHVIPDKIYHRTGRASETVIPDGPLNT